MRLVKLFPVVVALAFLFSFSVLILCCGGGGSGGGSDGTAQAADPANGQCQKTVVSGFVENAFDDEEYTVINVPADKVFVLTDIVVTSRPLGSGHLFFWILENEAKRLYVRFTFDNEVKTLHFNSGMPFGPGSNANIRVQDNSGCVLLSGYLADN